MSEHIKSAQGLTGYLCRTFEGDNVFLRIYDEEGYTDYDVLHCDMKITIYDDDAHVYKDEDGYYIDYSPETLGKQEVENDTL